MIVRDEAEMLPAFLEHARGLWDELVAVDTGSRDSTPAILAAAGARVASRPWDGDFSAARNASLDLAEGDWVLVLDADEMASPSFVAAARTLLADEAAGAATVAVRNRLPHGNYGESRLLRMFRRDPGIRFQHAIHEDASESVLCYLRRTGRRLVPIGGRLDHLGYVRSRAAAKDKKSRDVGLLERCIASDPADLYSHFKLLEQARFWGDRSLWHRAAVAAAAALRSAPQKVCGAHYGGSLVALVADGLHRGSPLAALGLLDAWEGRIRPSAAFYLRRGELREVAGRPDLAAADFERCRSLARETQDLQLATVRPTLALMRLALARGDLGEALRLTDEALSLSPRDPEALLAAAALRRARGGRDAVRAFARDHAGANGDPDELHEAVGEEALLAGDLSLAIPSLARAAGDPPQGRAALRLALARLAAGEVPTARAIADRLSPSLPEAGLVELLCDLCEGRDSQLALALDREDAESALRGMATVLARVARPEVRARLVAAAPAAEAFPWLPAALAGPR
ncbi:MAG TPA: glycosyltransferase family 2 protein [Anaeromyxobacteraceae bacterium]|nr:glycosyltransferase family 2 protein [Anaeromyxobacteraceae bacterium]